MSGSVHRDLTNTTLGEIYTCILLRLHAVASVGSWREVTMLAAIPCAVAFPTACLFLQESPYFLDAAGRRKQAVEVVQRMARWNGCPDLPRRCGPGAEGDLLGGDGDGVEEGTIAGERTSLLRDDEWNDSAPRCCKGPGLDALLPATVAQGSRIFQNAAARPTTIRIGKMRHRVAAQVAEELCASDRIKIIFSPGLRGTVFGVAYFCFLANFLTAGLNFALPQVFARLEREQHLGLRPTVQTLIACLSDLLGVVVVLLFLHKRVLHREGLLLLSMVCAVQQSFAVVIGHGKPCSWFALPAVYSSRSSANALSTVSFIYLSEVFELEYRCTALAFCIAVGFAGAILAPSLFVAFNETAGPGPFMAFNAALCAIGAVLGRRLLAAH